MKLRFLYTDKLVLQNNATLNNYGLTFSIYTVKNDNFFARQQ